jgi:hypothetical protein
MKLSFRGAKYESRPTAIETVESEENGTYRGAPLKIHHYQQLARHRQYSQEMIYRGVHYRAK